MKFIMLFSALWWGNVSPSVVVVGDSIAVGVGQAMDVPTFARVGATSCEIYQQLPNHIDNKTVILSAGSNDPPGPCLVPLRQAITGNVIWILPIDEKTRNHVLTIAKERGDGFIDFLPAADNVHPKSYVHLAERLKERLP
jgi:hypothetical protein